MVTWYRLTRDLTTQSRVSVSDGNRTGWINVSRAFRPSPTLYGPVYDEIGDRDEAGNFVREPEVVILDAEPTIA